MQSVTAQTENTIYFAALVQHPFKRSVHERFAGCSLFSLMLGLSRPRWSCALWVRHAGRLLLVRFGNRGIRLVKNH